MTADPIVAFDGVCNFCNFWINKVIDWDRSGRIKFISLQQLQEDDVLPKGTLESVILFFNGMTYRKSRAALKIGSLLPFPYKLISIFWIFPTFITDPIYDFVAARRYKWFGKQDTCRIPTPGERSRFIDSSLLANFAAENN